MVVSEHIFGVKIKYSIKKRGRYENYNDKIVYIRTKNIILLKCLNKGFFHLFDVDHGFFNTSITFTKVNRKYFIIKSFLFS